MEGRYLVPSHALHAVSLKFKTNSVVLKFAANLGWWYLVLNFRGTNDKNIEVLLDSKEMHVIRDWSCSHFVLVLGTGHI